MLKKVISFLILFAVIIGVLIWGINCLLSGTFLPQNTERVLFSDTTHNGHSVVITQLKMRPIPANFHAVKITLVGTDIATMTVRSANGEHYYPHEIIVCEQDNETNYRLLFPTDNGEFLYLEFDSDFSVVNTTCYEFESLTDALFVESKSEQKIPNLS